MALPLIPLLVIGGAAAYIASERSPALKQKKTASKKRLLDAAEGLRDKIEARRRQAEDSRWRVLRREPWVAFRPTNTKRAHTLVGNQFVVRVGTKDRVSGKNDREGLLYPMSASDEIGYNYYEVVFTAENEYDFDSLGNPIQKLVEAKKIYDELPGPRRIQFFAYEGSGVIEGQKSDDYLCNLCSYRDAALIEFSKSGEVIGLATAEPSSDAIEVLKKRFPRPGDLSKSQRLKKIWLNLTKSQKGTVRDLLGKNRTKKLEELILNEASDDEIMWVVRDAADTYRDLPALEQGRLAFRAQSSLGQEKITEIVEILA